MTDTDAEIRTFQCVLDQGHAGPHEPYVAPTVDEWRADVHDHAVDALRYLARRPTFDALICGECARMCIQIIAECESERGAT